MKRSSDKLKYLYLPCAAVVFAGLLLISAILSGPHDAPQMPLADNITMNLVILGMGNDPIVDKDIEVKEYDVPDKKDTPKVAETRYVKAEDTDSGDADYEELRDDILDEVYWYNRYLNQDERRCRWYYKDGRSYYRCDDDDHYYCYGSGCAYGYRYDDYDRCYYSGGLYCCESYDRDCRRVYDDNYDGYYRYSRKDGYDWYYYSGYTPASDYNSYTYNRYYNSGYARAYGNDYNSYIARYDRDYYDRTGIINDGYGIIYR